MFGSVGWLEILILVLTGLFVFGPERLPSAAAWAGRAVRQVREYANSARDQLRTELGPEYDELSKPLEDLRGLRDFNPKRAATKYLFADDVPPEKPNGYPAAQSPATRRDTASNRPPALKPGEKAPFDPDAT